MKRIHVLINRDDIVNYAMMPLRYNRKQLKEQGYQVNFFYKPSAKCLECDVLCLISKPTIKILKELSPVFDENGPVLQFLKQARQFANRIVWMDDSDSTSVTHFEVLPYVDKYLKKQLFKDRKYYRKKLYGGRIFSDFYHEHFGVTDEREFNQFYALDEKFEDKIGLSWNIGLGYMYQAFSYESFLHKWFPDLKALKYAPQYTSIEKNKPIDVFLRTTANMGRNSISFHRQEMLRQLEIFMEDNSEYTGMIGRRVFGSEKPVTDLLHGHTKKIPTRVFREIMKNTKIMPSPFGWGELGVRDYEAFIYGSALLKPDMSHMETWPNIFIPDETYVACKWDFSNMKEMLKELIDDDEKRLNIARNGQKAYQLSISSQGMDEFCNWFEKQVINE